MENKEKKKWSAKQLKEHLSLKVEKAKAIKSKFDEWVNLNSTWLDELWDKDNDYIGDKFSNELKLKMKWIVNNKISDYHKAIGEIEEKEINKQLTKK